MKDKKNKIKKIIRKKRKIPCSSYKGRLDGFVGHCIALEAITVELSSCECHQVISCLQLKHVTCSVKEAASSMVETFAFTSLTWPWDCICIFLPIRHSALHPNCESLVLLRSYASQFPYQSHQQCHTVEYSPKSSSHSYTWATPENWIMEGAKLIKLKI